MTGNSEATLWFCKSEKGTYEFNHIDDGHAETEKPVPKHPSQRGWTRGSWIKEHVWLDTSLPVRVIHDPDAKAARLREIAAAEV